MGKATRRCMDTRKGVAPKQWKHDIREIRTDYCFQNGGYSLVFRGFNLKDERSSQSTPNISCSPRSWEQHAVFHFQSDNIWRSYNKLKICDKLATRKTVIDFVKGWILVTSPDAFQMKFETRHIIPTSEDCNFCPGCFG